MWIFAFKALSLLFWGFVWKTWLLNWHEINKNENNETKKVVVTIIITINNRDRLFVAFNFCEPRKRSTRMDASDKACGIVFHISWYVFFWVFFDFLFPIVYAYNVRLLDINGPKLFVFWQIGLWFYFCDNLLREFIKFDKLVLFVTELDGIEWVYY